MSDNEGEVKVDSVPPAEATSETGHKKKSSRKSKSEDGESGKKTPKKPKKKTKKKTDVEWENTKESDSDADWAKEKDAGKESPSVWDPKQFDEQTGDLGSWKESNEPNRVQDLPSPTLAEAPPEKRKSKEDEEEWPFKSPCKLEEKKSKSKKTPRSAKRSDSDIDSEGEEVQPKPRSKRSSKKEGSEKGKSRKKRDSEPAPPSRSRGESGAGMDEPLKPKPRKNSDDDPDQFVQELKPEGDMPKKPKRRTPRRGSNESIKSMESQESDDLPQGSFHKLAKDFDKKPSRSNSRSRRPGSASGRRRRTKDRSMDYSGHDDDGSDAEFGEERDLEVKLKGDDDDAPRSSGSSRRSWRDRRSQNRANRTQNLGETSAGSEGSESRRLQMPNHLQAPGSAGRRTGSRRGGMRRASSERWMRAVEQTGGDEDAVNRRAQRANGEMSRSAHGVRRYHSGGVGMMASSLDARSYHGPSSQRIPADARRTPRRHQRTPESVDSAGSFGEEDDYEYEMNLSGRSARTLDSIEDLEDFEHIDFQTPGMVDIDEEMFELMQRANPEHTAQLNRRVHRKREAVHYDQEMPMMTRQALLTRQASAQVTKGRVDASSIDRKRLLMRNDSMQSQASRDEMDLSGHRPRAGARRAPPRSKSSGLGAMAMSRRGVPEFMAGAPSSTDPENRRGVFRTKSSTSSFRQTNKPNRVAQMSRRGDQIDPNSMRGSSHGPSRGRMQRAKSMGAPARPARSAGSGLTPTKPTRRIPKKKKQEEVIDSDLEDSDLDSDGEAPSPPKPPRRKQSKTTPPRSVSSPIKPVRKTVNKRDMSVKRNRRKLHAIMFEAKMGVNMKDLFKQVQKGEIPRPPIKTLMMPSP